MDKERELSIACAKGDKMAQKELYQKYAAKLNTLCLRYSSDEDSATDLMHDAMIKAFDKMAMFRYNGEGSLYAWIKRLTINMAIDRIRKRRPIFIPLGSFPEQEEKEEEAEGISGIPAEDLLGMVSSLPKVQRMVFNMYCIDGYSHKEIAEALRISEKGSASILAKARAQLRMIINEYLASTK